MVQLLKQHEQLENLEFLRDIQDLFSEKRFSHVGHWRYSEPLFDGDPVNGLHYWNKMVEEAKTAGQYYIFSDELELIRNSVQHISNNIDVPVTLVDLGPGSKEAVQNKIGYLIKNIGKPVSHYIGIDIVPEVLESTELTFKQEFPFIKYSHIQDDFFRHKLSLPQSPNVLMAIFGVTMFNLPIDPTEKDLTRMMMLSILKKMRANLVKGAHFIVTQDCNADIPNIISSYQAQNDVWMNMLERIIRDLPISGNFYPDNFKFEPYWIAETSSLSHTYVAKKDMRFKIGEIEYNIQKNKRFYLHNSYKFSTGYFCQLAVEAGFKTILTNVNDSQRMALHLLKAV